VKLKARLFTDSEGMSWELISRRDQASFERVLMENEEEK
jgi:hypothetical protein